MTIRGFFAWALPVLLLGLVQCSSGPAPRRAWTVQSGQRTRVQLVEIGGSTFVLQNKSSAAPAEVYRDARTYPLLKVCADADLQQLLDALATCGMADKASTSVAPDARTVLVVEQGGRAWFWSQRSSMLVGNRADGGEVQVREQDFHQARSCYLSFYNRVMAFRSSDAQKGAMNEESARGREEAEAARRRLEQLQGTGRTGGTR